MTAILRHAERSATPWKDGGGTTAEIARFPSGAGFDDLYWRVSTAVVGGSGPFSRFAGIERCIVVLGEEGLLLDVGGVEHRVDPLRPFVFPGDVATSARLLSGPVRDLNVMTRRGVVVAEVEVLGIGGGSRIELAVGPRGDLLVVAVCGRPSVTAATPAGTGPAGTGPAGTGPLPLAAGPDQRDPIELGPLDAFHCQHRGAVSLGGEGVVIAVRLERLGLERLSEALPIRASGG